MDLERMTKIENMKTRLYEATEVIHRYAADEVDPSEARRALGNLEHAIGCLIALREDRT